MPVGIRRCLSPVGNADLGEDVARVPHHGVLADDQLYINSASGVCTTQLAVEANALGNTNSDCGGRTPNYDVIDGTYTVLATGGSSVVADLVNMDDKSHSDIKFPWLAQP